MAIFLGNNTLYKYGVAFMATEYFYDYVKLIYSVAENSCCGSKNPSVA